MKSSSKKLYLDLPIVFLVLISTAGFFFLNQKPAEAISTESLDYILYLLRSRGHSLFANGISTSDLLFDVLSLPSLTLLPPSDSALFALDMTADSPALYLATLRLHVIPFRIVDFRNNASLPTLAHSRRLRVANKNGDGVVVVDGVEVIFPAVYYQSNVAVYALRGMLPPPDRLASSSPPPFQWFRPRIPSTDGSYFQSPAATHQLAPSPNPTFPPDVSFPPAELESNNPTVVRRFPPAAAAEEEETTDYPDDQRDGGDEESYSEDYAMQQSHKD
ncbi:Fasciclin-like arabinogalactan protein 19 [Linum grandiflorum]